jgi:hypothetical protein
MKLILDLLTRRTRSLSVISVAVGSLTLLAPPAANAISLISNGSFESPVGPVSPGLNSARPTGWSGFGSFSSGVINGTLANFPAPQDGNQFVNIGNGELVQAFTVVTPGDYSLTWFDNTLTSGNNGSYGVRVSDGFLTTSFTAYSYNYSGAPWHARSLDLNNLTAGTYTLTYTPGTSFTFLDNVVLDLKTTTSVPETGSTAGLLGLAFLGITLLAGSRRGEE